jgi:hypothetical protein
VLETLIPEFRSFYGAIRIPGVANKGVSVRTEQILKETYPIAAHRTLSLGSSENRAVLNIGFDLTQKAIFDGAARPGVRSAKYRAIEIAI